MMINGIDFKWSGVKVEKEDVALVNFIESLQKQTDEEIFNKSYWMIAVSYLIKRKIKKVFFEVISKTKFVYIEFCSRK